VIVERPEPAPTAGTSAFAVDGDVDFSFEEYVTPSCE
jgi:hypothetical protein